jgi:hypothetical protein
MKLAYTIITLSLIACAGGMSNKEQQEETKRILELDTFVNNDVTYKNQQCTVTKLCNNREVFLVCNGSENVCVTPDEITE